MANEQWLTVAQLLGRSGVRRFAANLSDLLQQLSDALPADDARIARELARAAERCAESARVIK